MDRFSIAACPAAGLTPRRLRGRAAAVAAAALLALALAGAAPAEEGDASEFFRRLESIGLDTTRIRQVRSELSLYYRESSEVAEAEFAFIRNNLYVPPDFKEAGSMKVKFDLPPHQLQTMVHEFSHADLDFADCSAAEGTAEREHCEVHKVVKTDIANDPNHTFIGLSRYPRMKADEVLSYFIGKAIARVFEAADDIVLWNKTLGLQYLTAEQLADPAGPLVLPAADTQNPWGKNLLTTTFGQPSVYDDARFQASGISDAELIHWNETGRDELKLRAYNGIFKFNPPRDLAELLRRMNTLDNAWLKQVRAEVAAARAARLKANPPAAGATIRQGGTGSAPLGQGQR